MSFKIPFTQNTICHLTTNPRTLNSGGNLRITSKAVTVERFQGHVIVTVR